MAERDEDFRLLAERLQRSDPLYKLRRVTACTVCSQKSATAPLTLCQSGLGHIRPYNLGQVVRSPYRRRRGDAANPGRHGVFEKS